MFSWRMAEDFLANECSELNFLSLPGRNGLTSKDLDLHKPLLAAMAQVLPSLNKAPRNAPPEQFLPWTCGGFGLTPLFKIFSLTASTPTSWDSHISDQHLRLAHSIFFNRKSLKRGSYGGAPKERRRRRAEKRLSKRVFLESPFLLCPLKVFRTFRCFKSKP